MKVELGNLTEIETLNKRKHLINLKLDILHSDMPTSVYVCKYSFNGLSHFSVSTLPVSHTSHQETYSAPSAVRRSLYICQICFNVYNFL